MEKQAEYKQSNQSEEPTTTNTAAATAKWLAWGPVCVRGSQIFWQLPKQIDHDNNIYNFDTHKQIIKYYNNHDDDVAL